MQNEECGRGLKMRNEVGPGCHEIESDPFVSQDSKATWTSDPQASITLSQWISFQGFRGKGQ